MKNTKIVYKRKKIAILHITTARRLQDLFSVRSICPVLMEEPDLIYSMNQEVFLTDETYGFLVDDDLAGRGWSINTFENIVIAINKIPCHPPDLSYIYSESEIKDFWPIRIRLQGMKMAMTYSRVVCSVNSEGKDSRIIQS